MVIWGLNRYHVAKEKVFQFGVHMFWLKFFVFFFVYDHAGVIRSRDAFKSP